MKNKLLKISVLISLVSVSIVPFSIVSYSLYKIKPLLSDSLSYKIYSQDGKTRLERVVGHKKDNWTGISDIPLSCKTALIAAEDTRFYEHFGVDFKAIKETIILNSKLKQTKFGASTITQQLVKNALLSRERTLTRKIKEALLALTSNLLLSKTGQLEWYFNIIEFGPDVYGIKQASSYYFGKTASELSPSQCIALISILPSPIKWGRNLKEQNITDFLHERYEVILRRMRRMELTPVDAILYAYSNSPFNMPWISHKFNDILWPNKFLYSN